MTPEVNFACGTCGNGLVVPLDDRAGTTCARCGGLARLAAPAPGVTPLERCAACASPALFVQRDFNRILGLSIVGVAALFAVKTRGLSLLAAALVDGVLYRALPRITICYACDAVHRSVPVHPEHGAYDHHIEDTFKEEKSKRQVAAQAWRRAHEA